MKLSYSTHGLPGDLFNLIDEFEKVGYLGVELAFQEGQFDPRNMTLESIPTDPFILKIKDYFKTKKIKPACINTATLPMIPGRLHEPTMISIKESGRNIRTNIIKKGIEVAKVIGAPIVGFGSGFIRDEHVKNPSVDPMKLLLESIEECLKSIGDSDVILAIEPEPGMLIETQQEGLEVVKKINHPSFKLHMDLCHAFCSDIDYVKEIEKVAPYTCYLHLSDAGKGYNLKFITACDDMQEKMDLDFAAYMVHFEDKDDFLLIDKEKSIYFYNKDLSADEKAKTKEFVKSLNNIGSIEYVSYKDILAMPKPSDYVEKEKEIKCYLLSMPAIAYDVLDRANPIVHYLRRDLESNGGKPIIEQMVANTLTGNVHYHDVPGNGDIEFAPVFEVLEKHNFTGYGTLELYHHGETWRDALNESMVQLGKYCSSQKKKNPHKAA